MSPGSVYLLSVLTSFSLTVRLLIFPVKGCVMKHPEILVRYCRWYVTARYKDETAVFSCYLYNLFAGCLDLSCSLVQKHVDRSDVAAKEHLAVEHFFRLCNIDLLVEKDT